MIYNFFNIFFLYKTHLIQSTFCGLLKFGLDENYCIMLCSMLMLISDFIKCGVFASVELSYIFICLIALVKFSFISSNTFSASVFFSKLINGKQYIHTSLVFIYTMNTNGTINLTWNYILKVVNSAQYTGSTMYYQSGT